MQQDLFNQFEQQHADGHRLPMKDADVCYYPDFLEHDQAQRYFQQLKSRLQWRQEKIRIYNKTYDVPRLQAWYGDAQALYRYSNLTLQPLPWTTELTELKNRVEIQSATKFNAVLANLYRHNNDSMGMHADDEAELGENPIIASLSLGENRTFIFAHKLSKKRIKLNLNNGSLLIMRGTTQQYWQHGIAKQSAFLAPRINLTYRYIYPSS